MSRLPLANPAAAEKQIVQFLDDLLAAPPEQANLLPLLEQLRVTMAFVEEEMGRRYYNKPLVLGDVEEGCFRQVVSNWNKLENAYLRLLDNSETESFARTATILHRCLHSTGMVILEHFRARREVPPGLWLKFHRYFQIAERRDVATTPVDDGIEDGRQPTHCTAAYVALLLTDAASPYSRSVRDINLIQRWAAHWAPLVSVYPLEAEDQMPGYLVELGKDAGLHPVEKGHPAHPDQRGLDTSRMARQIEHTLSQLRQKILPSQLGLGEEKPGHVATLLGQLSRPWGQLAVARKFRRFAASGKAVVCVGFEAMHFAISGRAFEQPEVSDAYRRGELDALFNYRGMIVPTQGPVIRGQEGCLVDEWDVINHSANGFRLARTSVGQKMCHGQLLALCPHDGERFLLAQNTWLMQESDGGMVAGVEVLPGLPVGVSVRISGSSLSGKQHPCVRGFLLSPVPKLADKGSLVLPVGIYQASRVVEVYNDGLWQIRLKHILQQGTDFERVSFETV